MRFRQLMYMPSGVEHWLDQELESRGIDTLVYTGYILSLLQEDNALSQSYFSPNKKKNCGIELLVDELCVKLKEIQNQAVELLPPLQQTQTSKYDVGDISQHYYSTADIWPDLTMEHYGQRVAYYHQDNMEQNKESKRLYDRKDDENLKHLFSKFDHNIESLWGPDETRFGPSIWSDQPWSFSAAAPAQWSTSDNTSTLNALNHTAASCFTQVLPKYQPVVQKTEPNVIVPPVEEEDLLTSAKTHFRPIRSEDCKNSKAPMYADGTTFIIANDWEKVPFKRSESGTLYLESDVELEAPKMYMEFKVQSTNNSSWEEEFVPKFRVKQSNEKCIQTDDFQFEQIVPSLEKTEAEEYVANINRKFYSDPDDFYFPGDDELADEIVLSEDEIENEEETIEEDEEVEEMEEIEVLSNSKLISDVNSNEIATDKSPNDIETCFCSNSWRQNWAKAWEKKKEEQSTWQQIWNIQNEICKNCSSDNQSSDKAKEKQFSQLREELSEDGEQLFSDLSCYQRQYLAGSMYDDEDDDVTDVSSDMLDDAPDFNFLNLSDEQLETKSIEVNKQNVETYSQLLLTKTSKNITWFTDTVWRGRPTNTIWKFGSIVEIDDWPANFKIMEHNEDDIKNERPLPTAQKDRKRRHSSSQKVCKRVNTRFVYTDVNAASLLYTDAVQREGDGCQGNAVNSLRPLTL